MIGPGSKIIWTTVQLIHRLRERFGRQITIVVWTGGEPHAWGAVRKCKLVDIVDLVVSKPAFIVDDCEELHLSCFTQFINPIALWQKRNES